MIDSGHATRQRRQSADRLVVKSLVAALIVCVILGALAALLVRAKHTTDREAVRSAYINGRLSREQASELLGPQADLSERPATE